MTTTAPIAYVAVVKTTGNKFDLAHDAAKPYAVVQLIVGSNRVVKTYGRYTTYHGGSIKAGKVAKEENLKPAF